LLKGMQMLGEGNKVMMLYTEDEARAKLCPFLQTNCRAPNCVAWAADRSANPSAEKQGYCVLRVAAVPTPVAGQGRVDSL
jgi:hypothetical protein